MRVQRGLSARGAGDRPVVLTIGSFDGVHRGHAALLERVAAIAQPLDGERVVLTFDPHPRCVLDPARCPRSLMTLPEKLGVLEETGVDRCVVLEFTREVSGWSAERFCDLLREAFDLRGLVVGHDFALGHKRQGDVAFLTEYGARHGFGVDQVDALEVGGEPVSSSRIRTLVEDGDMGGAATLLGRQHFLDAVVEHGEEVGRHLGFPTANLSFSGDKCLPASGVYAMWVRVDGAWHMAATNVGYRPTFGGNRLTVEAFLLDFAGDLYERDVRAAFVERLREERAYDSVGALVEQIGRDVEEVRRLLSGSTPPA